MQCKLIGILIWLHKNISTSATTPNYFDNVPTAPIPFHRPVLATVPRKSVSAAVNVLEISSRRIPLPADN